ncbi:MAG: NADH dehydrogenase [Paracoccaceae bacterium]|jgi:NADH dehydrogenase
MTSAVTTSGHRPRLFLASDRAGVRQRPPTVIFDGGFGSLTVAKKLARTSVDLTLIDRENHHLFQPLHYQVATAGLSPADIIWPIPRLVRQQKNTRALLGEVTGVDKARKRVCLGDREIGYDIFVLATGETHGYFGNDDWAAYAPGLKAIADATEIRRRQLLTFKRAEMEHYAEKRRRLLIIVISGGGPTGVEMAGALVEFARKALAVDFRDVDTRQTHVVPVEARLPRLAERRQS